jgi:phage replication-related protein YjqB (UPF0714/DUF867 family)
MPKDCYDSFIDLVAKGKEREGIDYRICLMQRPSAVAVIAPHGGTIERWTSEIASAIAGHTYSLYCFEGLRPCDHHELHITSNRFDEPRGCMLVGNSDVVVTVHGKKNRASKAEFIEVGGLDADLRDAIRANLKDVGFDATIATKGMEGKDKANICNRGRRRRGVQLEISLSLRDAIFREPGRPRLPTLADAIRSAISVHRD